MKISKPLISERLILDKLEKLCYNMGSGSTFADVLPPECGSSTYPAPTLLYYIFLGLSIGGLIGFCALL